MKQLMIVIFLLCLCLAGCREESVSENNGGQWEGKEAADVIAEPIASRAVSDDAVVYIKEKMFIEQINDIYLNQQDFIGKTIKYEGIFDEFYWEETDHTYYSVIRYGPGCCSFDANAGFEVQWDGEYPKANDWVEVTGTLEQYEENGETYLQLALDSLIVLDQRGKEYVD